MAGVTLNGIVKEYGAVRVIHGVDLEIADGEFCVFVGPSGCGKSTLLRMIAGLEEITDGDLMIGGDRVNDQRASERGLAMVFQTYALYPHMSVRANLAFGLENIRMARAEIDSRVAEAARMLQLEPYLDRKPKALSGGQRQRVAIGRAVVREPKVFLFDEPLSNLDAELRVTMRGEIAALHRRIGNTMIYVTHDQVEAMTMADRIVVLRDGRIEQQGAPIDLYNRPVNKFVAGFIGSPRMNFIACEVVEADGSGVQLRDPSGRALLAHVDGRGLNPGNKVELGVRPEHLHPVGADENGITATVENIEQLGGESYLYCHGPDGVDVTVHMTGQTALGRGAQVVLGVTPDLCHIFRPDGIAQPRLRLGEAVG
ncbi:Maltose/maltodextrin import ATP-binding protein MalK [Roseibaca ekhonensis]|jgi:multiple sugar transport system ATP-binding protein|uniref:Maltose/maltodextrin import ATP-binding protein MalK n=1 Tax=Roseinatronobacter ekhonensis TaxID=254356 RepID=A0A3B0MTD3_9RHOB|nr:sn-glycerol-3-phosphate ABC transporter ATP-binding protein UgpC [Roseibaca ekhonensis]SUZ32899.1 Maltose/maltodextrin import ATP-binding protein MalK [Roseibaca ekhonensis]